MICNAELGPNYFSVNVSVLAVAFRWQIKKKAIILPEIVVILQIVTKIP